MKNNLEEHDLYKICPYFTSQKILSGKWALLILHYLDESPLRFKELERKLKPITQATLTKQLRSLEKYGLITRTVYNQIPPKVEYSLSELGILFRPVLKSLEKWGNDYISYMSKKSNNPQSSED